MSALRYISGNFSVNISALSEGRHNWTLNLIDEAGNNASSHPNVSTNNFTVDRSPPVFILQLPTNGGFIRGRTANTTTINFTFQVIDRFIATNLSAYVILDSTDLNRTLSSNINGITNNTNVTLVINVTEGIHFWNVTTNDTYANNSNTSLTFNFTIDNSAPNITLVFPTEGLVFSQGGITFNWTVTDNLDTNLTVNLTLNSQTNQTFGSLNATSTTFTIFLLDTGNYNWSITAQDNAGNANTSITINFTVRIPGAGTSGGGGGGMSTRTTRRGLPTGGLLLTVYTSGRVSVDVGGTYRVLDLIRTTNNEYADVTFGTSRSTLKQGTPTALDVNGDGVYDVTVTAVKIYPKRVDMRVVPSGPSTPGQATLADHVVPRRPALTGPMAKPKSTPKTGTSACAASTSTTTGSGSSGLGAVSGRAVDEAPEAASEAAQASAGGFSVVMLVVSLLVLFSVVGLIYYLYSGKQQ